MEAWSRLPQQFPGTRVLFAAPQLDPVFEEACRQLPGKVELLHDPEGRTARRFNALWAPRAYTLDTAGTVTYVQPETTLDPQAPTEVRTLWSGGR